MLTVALFGRVQLAYGGKDVPFAARPKVAPLLAYLLLNCRQPVSRDNLAFALWPDETESAARTNLRRHLHYLREILPRARAPWFIADARTVCWNPAAQVRVDVADFARCAASPEELEKAVALYGEVLQGCDDEWLLAIRERLHRSYVQSLFELVRRARGRRDCASASGYLEQVLADDPWREDAVRALMSVRFESGDRSSALQLCAEFEHRLKREMGAALMPETTALRNAIERGSPLPAVPLTPAPHTATMASNDLAFQGRDAELAQLRRLWERTVSGSGSFALVLGEAGIGKTRLASEFALAIEATGGRVFWGTTSTPETVPYQAITEVAKAALGFVDSSSLPPYDLEVLARLLPELQERESPKDPHGGPDSAKLYDVTGNLFLELGRQRPALFVFEDLHAAGRATIAMLEHIAQHCRQAAIMILATVREEDPLSADTLGRLRRPRDGSAPSIIPLAPLSERAAQAIVAQSLGSSRDASTIAARAAGHPLFLAELLYAAADPKQPIDAVPTRLREMIDARGRQFSADAGFLLRAAAVVGNSFDIEVVAETVGWSESRLAAATDELIARRVVRQTPSARTFEYEFAHDLIASAAYEAVPERQRQRWHRRVGRVAAQLYASRLTELSAFVARHFDLGGECDSAAAYYLRAAQRAASAFANDEALAYARRGLALKPRPVLDQYELLMLTENVLARVGDRAEQGAILGKLDRVVRKLGGGDGMRELLIRRANLQFNLGRHDAARRTLARLYRLSAGDARWEASALTNEAMVLNHSGRKSDAYATITRATIRATIANDPEILSKALLFNADIAAKLGRREEAEECLQRAKDVANELASPFLTMDVLLCEAAVFTYFQAWSMIPEPAHQLLDLATRVGNKNRVASAHMMLGAALGKLFDAESARQHFRAAIDLFRGRALHGVFFAYNNLAEIEAELGRVDKSRELLDEIAVVLPNLGTEHRAMTNMIASELARQRGELDAAIALADQALSATTALGNKLYEAEWLLCKSISLRASGRAAEAMASLERCLTLCRASGVKAIADRATAELALACAMASNARAASLADEVLASIESDSDVKLSPAALWSLSQALEAVGRNTEAREVLRRAHNAFEARMKRLYDRRDRTAFSGMPENAELERAYAASLVDSARPGAKAENPRVHPAPKTRTAGRLPPRGQSL